MITTLVAMSRPWTSVWLKHHLNCGCLGFTDGRNFEKQWGYSLRNPDVLIVVKTFMVVVVMLVVIAYVSVFAVPIVVEV